MSDLATLQTDVAGNLGLDFDASTPSSGDGPRLLGWANDACVDMLRRSHCFLEVANLTVTANVGDYRLDSAILAVDDILLVSDGQTYRVQRKATTDLLNLRISSTSTALIQYYALGGADLLMLYPTPLQADTITIYFVPRPTALSAPTDDPSTFAGIPEEFHYGLELYMMWKAADFSDDDGSQRGDTYRKMYLGDPNSAPGSEQRDGFIGTMKKDLRRKGGKHQAAIVLPPRNRRTYIPNPGVDVGSTY